jgi:hypothetical protein
MRLLALTLSTQSSPQRTSKTQAMALQLHASPLLAGVCNRTHARRLRRRQAVLHRRMRPRLPVLSLWVCFSRGEAATTCQVAAQSQTGLMQRR